MIFNIKGDDLETVATVMGSEEAIETVEDAISRLEELDAFNNLRKFVDQLSDRDKIVLYGSGAPHFLSKAMLRMLTPLGAAVAGAFRYENAALKFFGENGGAEAYRALVHFGLLPSPPGLDADQLQENAKSDMETEKKTLKALGFAIWIFAPKYLPEFRKIEKFLIAAFDLKGKTASRRMESREEAASSAVAEGEGSDSSGGV